MSIESLPNTLEELYSKYNMVYGNIKHSRTPTVTTATVAGKSAGVILLSDLVMSVICSGGSSDSERFRVFKLLENYPEVGNLMTAWY